MIKLSHHYVETKFIACILELYKLSNDNLNFRRDGSIGNPLLVQFIEKCYTKFMQSNKDYNVWFERQVIECSLTSNKTKVKIPDVEITGKPLFIAFFQPRTGYKPFFYPISDASFYADQPIPINLDMLFGYFNLDGPKKLTGSNCPSFVNLYRQQDGKVINDSTCPGISDSAEIEIAFDRTNYYWVLGQKVKRFKCGKYPGICSKLFKLKNNRERHEKICQIETTVKSKQVYFTFGKPVMTFH